MVRCTAFFVILTIVSSTASGLDEFLLKYRHRYLDIEEADVERIGEFLTSPDPEERGEAATQLSMALRKGFSSVQKFVPRLLELLKTDSDQGVRVSAGRALFDSGDPRAVQPLLEVASDTSLGLLLRSTALDLLSGMGLRTPEIEEIAVEELDSPDYHFRSVAIKVLGRSGDRQRLERLVEAYLRHHEQPEEAMKQIERSEALGGGTAYDWLSFMYRLASAAVLPYPDLLARLVNHPNCQVRADIAGVFFHKLDNRAVPILVDLVKASDPWIRSQAIRGLQYLGISRYKDRELILPQLVVALKDALNDEYTIPGKDGKPYRVLADDAYQALIRMGIKVDEPPDLKESRVPKIVHP